MASDESFSAEDASCRVDVSGESIDGDDVWRFVVPWAVLSPVGSADFIPRVVEGAI